ncbi:MAG TPA: hypothetical protein ENH00_02550 [Actinobacteria bacterium]|nr:hypothetical protein [Actinomycetota bacterium]
MTDTSTCLSCDTETQLTAQGLCGRCQDDLRFIVRPAAHREAYRRQVAAEADLRAEMQRLGVVVITSIPEDNSLWICDFCNTQIPADNEYTLIPLLGSYALCPFCVTTIPYWPDGWTQPTPRACRCGACQTPLLEASLRERRRTGPSLDPPSPGAGIER